MGEDRVVGVPVGAAGVEGGRIEVVERYALAQPLHDVGVSQAIIAGIRTQVAVILDR